MISAFLEQSKAVKRLKRDCDPGPLLAACRIRMQDQKLEESSPSLYALVICNSLEAALASGAGDISLGLLEGMRKVSEGAGGPHIWVLSWLYVSRGHILMERWAEAAEAQNKAMAYFNKGGMAPKGREALRQDLCANGYALQIHYGQAEGLEEGISELVKTAPNAWKTVEHRLLLGKYYLAEGRIREAREQLDYAVAHGNKLFAKFEAEELLRELEGKGPSGKKRARDALNRINEAFRLAAQTCDHTPAAEACEAALADEGVLGETEQALQIRMSFCAALVDLGRYGEAEAQLEQVRPDEGIFKEPAIALGLLHTRIVLDTILGRLHEAAREQNEAMALFRKKPPLEYMRRALTYSGCTLQIRLGQLDGVEERAGWLLETARDEFDRVTAHMTLGRYELAAGRAEAARPHLEYVAEHGNKLHHRAEAEELLKTLPA